MVAKIDKNYRKCFKTDFSKHYVSKQIFRNTTNLRQLCPCIFEDIFFYLILRDNLKNLEEKSLH